MQTYSGVESELPYMIVAAGAAGAVAGAWSFDRHRVVDGEVVEVELDIAVARERRWAQIKAERDRRESQGTFTALDSTFQSDPLRIGGAANGAQVALAQGFPFTLVWTLADNSTRTLTAVEMVQVGLAQLAYIDGLHATARTLRSAIEAATSAEQIEAIHWPQEPTP